MKKILAAVMLTALSVGANAADGERNGQFIKDNGAQVWSEASKNWLTPENFWREYAESRGGLTWGQGRDYPNYDDVNEHDTFLVEVDSGLCLMEFFHNRWRRANDVRRWDPLFNEHGGCPDVFK